MNAVAAFGNSRPNKRYIIIEIDVDDPRLTPAPSHLQRPFDATRVERLASDFKADKLGVIIVSSRDGKLYVLDGQTRVGAARKVKWHGKLNAIVWTGLTVEEEADMFITHNDSKAVSAFDKFRVRVTRADSVPVAISDILREHGWTLMTGTHDGSFAAVVAAEKIATRWGLPLFVKVIRTVTNAWGHKSAGVNGTVIQGIAEFYAFYGEKASEDRTTKNLEKVRPTTLLSESKVVSVAYGKPRAFGVAALIQRTYNKGLATKNHLPDFIA